MRLVEKLKDIRKTQRRKLLVPEFNPDGEPLAVFYFPATPRTLNIGHHILKEFQLEMTNQNIQCAYLAAMMLDENGDRLVPDADFIGFLEQADAEMVDRVANEMGNKHDISEAIETAKKN